MSDFAADHCFAERIEVVCIGLYAFWQAASNLIGQRRGFMKQGSPALRKMPGFDWQRS